MILGIGVDILNIDRLEKSLSLDDPFVWKTFTEKEVEEAKQRADPARYLISRFACKEAVFKCFKMDGNYTRLSEIEIQNSNTGHPAVILLGNLKKYAAERGIASIEVSLSHEKDYVVAYAIAQNNI